VETRHRLLGNRYELLSVLASGGMGRVWRARDLLLNRPVAVKVLRSEFTGDATFISRFRAEAQHAALLQHPNIAAVFDYGELEQDGEQLAYLVMELVEGESLAALRVREPRLDVPRTLSILHQTSAALAAAHAAGVVHRDVKPGNVLVAHDGTVKIADFGIAWSASSVPLTGTGQVIGTAHYLSPEQAAGGKATPASDVYALGAVAYECLAGRRAFEGENSVQVAVKHIHEEPDPLPADIPPAVRGLVQRAMVKDPARRFADGAALHRAVEQVLATSSAAPAATATTPIAVPAGQDETAVLSLPLAPAGAAAPRPRGGRRVAVRMLAGALAFLAVVALAVVLFGRDSGSPAQQPATTGTTTPAISVATTGYVGRPVAEVQAALVGKGLRVDLASTETADVPAGQVTAVAPVGDLTPGATVTVTYAVPPVAVPTTQPPDPEPAPQSPVSDTGQGNGNENNGNEGNGHDKGHDHGKGHGKKD
jgi:serine/threonine-protein kinase